MRCLKHADGTIYIWTEILAAQGMTPVEIADDKLAEVAAKADQDAKLGKDRSVPAPQPVPTAEKPVESPAKPPEPKAEKPKLPNLTPEVLDAMDKKALEGFAKMHFLADLDRRKTAEELRGQVWALYEAKRNQEKDAAK